MTYRAHICKEFLVCVLAPVYVCVSQRSLKLPVAENISHHVTELSS